MAALVLTAEDVGITKFVTGGGITSLLAPARFATSNATVQPPRGDLLLALAVAQQQQPSKKHSYTTTKRTKQQRDLLKQGSAAAASSMLDSMLSSDEPVEPIVRNLRDSRSRACTGRQQAPPMTNASSKCWMFDVALQSSML